MENESLNQSIDALSQALKELNAAKNNKFGQKYLDFHAESGESNSGRGIIFSGQGHTKQIIYQSNPDRFFVSETIDLHTGKSISISGLKVLDEKELGPSVTKSNLREVGRLKGLIVDGNIAIDQYLFYNSSSSRIGLGTDEPNATLSLVENGVEVVLGTNENIRGMVGTFAHQDFDIVTDNISRVSIKANGNIELGSPLRDNTQVKVSGKLSVNVNNPDPMVDVHIAGPIKIHNHLHMYADKPPTTGTFTMGDIVWNSNPRTKACVGWVCTHPGNPGAWSPFGEIK